MRIFLLVLGSLGLAFGVFAFADSARTGNVLHETESLIGFLIGATSFGSAGIIRALNARK